MRKIFKYEIEQTDEQVLSLPKGAKILSIIEQYNKPVIYAIVDPNEKEIDNYNVVTLGTGFDVYFELPRPSYKFLGTLSFMGGNLIFHYFYKLVFEE